MEFETILIGREIINGTTNSSNIHLLISKNMKKQLMKHNNKIFYLFKLNVNNYTIELKQINKKNAILKNEKLDNSANGAIRTDSNNKNRNATSFITNSISCGVVSANYFNKTLSSSGPSSTPFVSNTGTYLNQYSGSQSGSSYFRKDDEGFESDVEFECEDFSLNSSEESSTSSSSSNHNNNNGLSNRIFELKNIYTDSANSSGTDSDDINEKINVNIKNIISYEIYNFNDIIFLHNDVKYPKILVFIVKINKNTNHIVNTPLEAILLQFNNYENIKSIFNNYNEIKKQNKYNNKLKNRQINYNGINNYSLLEKIDLDGITHIEITSNNTSDDKSIQNNEMIESIDYRPSCIISINTPELGNIETIPISKISNKNQTISTNNNNSNEIDAIIYTENDPNVPTRPERRKKKQNTNKSMIENQQNEQRHYQEDKIVRGKFIKINVMEHKIKNQSDQIKENINKQEDQQLIQKLSNDIVDKVSIKSDDIIIKLNTNQPICYFHKDKRLNNSDHKIYKSDSKYVNNNPRQPRNVEKRTEKYSRPNLELKSKEKLSKPQHEARTSIDFNEYTFDRNHQYVKSLDYRNNYSKLPSISRDRYYKNIIKPINYTNIDYNNKKKYRSRSKSPPLRKFPMTSSYIDQTNNNSISNKIFNKLRDFKNEIKFQKNSSLDLAMQPNSQFYMELDSVNNYKKNHLSKSTPNLKSVLIKNKNNNYLNNNNNEELSEPKKVTFSAYATVQVVD